MDTEHDTSWLLREKYNGEKSEGFFADCKRLEAGEPVAYVIGWQPFLNVKIQLSSSGLVPPTAGAQAHNGGFPSGTGISAKQFALIPRPETEWWTKLAIEHIKKHETPRVLDLCAGSGAIGVAVLKAVPMARIDFAEIDTAHHETIVNNICDNGTDYTRTRVFGGDLFSEIPTETTYDYILSNPPYIDPALDRTEVSVRNHEPHLALYGGEGGMEIIERILRDARTYHAQNGELWIEHEPEQAERIIALGRELGYRTCETLRDQFGVLRVSRILV